MLALASLIATSAIASDEVTSLPGWAGALPSKQYSGYLPVGQTSGVKGYIHYWYAWLSVERQRGRRPCLSPPCSARRRAALASHSPSVRLANWQAHPVRAQPDD